MGQQCTICVHPERVAIDHALVAGELSNRRVAAQYGITEQSVRRHRAEHLKARLMKASRTRDDADLRTAIDVRAQLQAVNAATLEILAEARTARDGDLALKAIDRIQKQLELQAKLIGDLADGTTVNVTIQPAWITLRTVIVGALAPYPDARLAVAEALQEIDGSTA